jgi:hypothetical protein
MPRRQAAKLKALQQCLGVIRTAINAKRWAQARYGLSRARALVSALPADQTTKEREQLSLLRKRFDARNTPAAKTAAKTAVKNTTKKKTAPKPSVKKAARSADLDLGSRLLDRAALGYAPVASDANRTKEAH